MKKRLISNQGFTLIEMLIVVAIIGVLATIGIPTFKQMVQKSKQSEAKVGLGGIFTAETAFYGEYGTYGSMLDKIGYTIEGNGRIYSIGFQDATCAASPAISAPVPDPTSTQGVALTSRYPDYYNGLYSVYNTGLVIMPTSGSCLASSIDPTQFVATANGIIAPTASPATDQWSMDFNRNLTNVKSGVQ